MSRQPRELEPVGLVGLGLMGRSIAACLLASGLEVVAYNRTARRARAAAGHIAESLDLMVRRRLVRRRAVSNWRKRFTLVGAMDGLAGCPFVIETIREDLALKRRLFKELEEAISPRAVIASNTSSFPVSLLCRGSRRPERFIVMHWAEPAWLTRYLEIVPGDRTSPRTVRLTRRLGQLCGKHPTVLNFDIRGFISNRLMYAMIREAIYLVESGVADVATVDQSFRNDIGWWATLAGPFRWMDLTGIAAYAAVMDGLFPELCNSRKLPELMKRAIARGARGIANARGFYRYTKASARQWERAWTEFTFDIRRLVEKYDRLAPGRPRRIC